MRIIWTSLVLGIAVAMTAGGSALAMGRDSSPPTETLPDDDRAAWEPLLEEGHASAVELFEKSAPVLRSAFGDALAPVENAMTDWDFAEALKALRAVKDAHVQLR